MRLYLLIGALVIVMVTTSAAAPEHQAVYADMAKFRQAYDGSLFAEDAVRDFEEVEKRIGDLVARLNREGEISDSANAELMDFVQQLEREYIVRWFGSADGQQRGFLGSPTMTQTNSNYDSQFREQTRRSKLQYAPGASPPDGGE